MCSRRHNNAADLVCVTLLVVVFVAGAVMLDVGSTLHVDHTASTLQRAVAFCLNDTCMQNCAWWGNATRVQTTPRNDFCGGVCQCSASQQLPCFQACASLWDAAREGEQTERDYGRTVAVMGIVLMAMVGFIAVVGLGFAVVLNNWK